MFTWPWQGCKIIRNALGRGMTQQLWQSGCCMSFWVASQKSMRLGLKTCLPLWSLKLQMSCLVNGLLSGCATGCLGASPLHHGECRVVLSWHPQSLAWCRSGWEMYFCLPEFHRCLAVCFWLYVIWKSCMQLGHVWGRNQCIECLLRWQILASLCHPPKAAHSARDNESRLHSTLVTLTIWRPCFLLAFTHAWAWTCVRAAAKFEVLQSNQATKRSARHGSSLRMLLVVPSQLGKTLRIPLPDGHWGRRLQCHASWLVCWSMYALICITLALASPACPLHQGSAARPSHFEWHGVLRMQGGLWGETVKASSTRYCWRTSIARDGGLGAKTMSSHGLKRAASWTLKSKGSCALLATTTWRPWLFWCIPWRHVVCVCMCVGPWCPCCLVFVRCWRAWRMRNSSRKTLLCSMTGCCSAYRIKVTNLRKIRKHLRFRNLECWLPCSFCSL